ncbi:MAG: DMT family transporter [Lachnospirales bacterium]
MSNKLKGIIFTLIGGVFWGFSGVCGQYLFEQKGIDARWLSTWRLIFSGFFILIVTYPKIKKNMFSVFKKENILSFLVFAFISVACCQYSYFMAIYNSNSATATVLEYIAPALVMVFICFSKRKLPSITQFFALILAMSGVFFMATGGNINSMQISPKALFWGLLSGVCYGVYTIQSPSLSRKSSVFAMLGWGNLIGSLPMILLNDNAVSIPNLDLPMVLAFLGTTILGSVLSYGLYVKGCQLAGSVTGSLCACVEPVASAVIAFLWLGTDFKFSDILGLILIMITVVVLTLSNNSRNKTRLQQN